MSSLQTFQSTDVDESIEIGSRAFYSHTLAPTHAGAPFSFSLQRFQAGDVMIGRLNYGCEVDIEVGGLDEIYGVNVPQLDPLNASVGSRELVGVPGQAVIVGPVGEMKASGWASGSAALTMVRFDRRVLEAELGRIIDEPITAPIQFAYVLNLTTGRGAEWWRVAHTLYTSATEPGGIMSSPILAAQFASVLMSGLLLAAEHPYREALERDGSPTPPAAIRRAVEFIDENAHLPITIPDVAAAIGANVRTLQRGFTDHLSTTPVAYLGRVRLENVHRELALGSPETTSVTTVATAWGFFHLGRFAARYRDAYGVSPSRTLRQE